MIIRTPHLDYYESTITDKKILNYYKSKRRAMELFSKDTQTYDINVKLQDIITKTLNNLLK